ncbi:CBY1-interacting BAR domain-containing protein 1-B-like isoform X1 [Macrosteles quadrilineatus]|uniref:CBY1-interacting BAR domain-containing protein 1-B-like isoform X1 n=1 Tax=Macrosteles quadrilineatus TaxID=74068 RepID=UPI0023E33A34|nr:CBY1-interacting BAR domain-containing protein 1-B-like isoform X1 [Macrosteles quadrilineatus]
MNVIKTNKPESVVCEQQARFVLDRVIAVESNMAELCSTFSLFSRKAARVRDATDEIAKVLACYAESETINTTLKTRMSEVAKTFNLLGDFRELEVQRLDKKVVDVFGQYEGICHRSKEELKVILSARDKELNHQRQLDRLIQRNPHNRQQISKAETELIKASSEVSRNQKALEEQIDLFEKKKLKDLKMTLLDFIKIELALHAKALELYTQAYNEMSEVDEDLDLEDFQNARGNFDLELKNVLTSDSGRLDTVKRTSFRHSSLQSIANLFSTPQRFQRRESTSIPTTSKSSLDDTAVQANEPQVESRIVSLRDESDEDELSSPFLAGSSQNIGFAK